MQDPLIAEAVKQFQTHLINGTKGLQQLSGIPLRISRIIVSVKFPGDDTKINRSELFSLVREALAAMGLAPEVLKPPELLEWARRLFNDYVPDGKDPTSGEWMAQKYDDSRPINTQVISAETVITDEEGTIRVGKNHWKCITPKSFPAHADPLQTKELFGGIWGVRSDNDQHKVPFLYTLNIVYDNLGNSLRNKCETVLQQGAAGSWARSLQRKQEEYKWCVDKFDLNETFAHIMPVMWLYSPDAQKLEDAVSRGKRMWEGAGYYMQEDKHIPVPMFLASLPMNFRIDKNTINMLERTHIMPGDVTCNVLPIQGGFSGSGEPVLVFPGREGQLCCFDIFSRYANNYNGYVAASTGAGKSFAINYIAGNQYFAGTLIRIIDIGGSYEKMADMLGGRYLDFKNDNDICINPFSNIVDPSEDLPAIAIILLQAVYSSSEAPVITEDEQTLAKNAVEWAYETAVNNADFNLLYDYLNTYPKHSGDSRAVVGGITELAHRMAFNMAEFTSSGRYGSLFNGEATFDISNDKFLVLELEALKQKKDLFKVVTLMILDAVTKDLYLSDRSQRRMVIFDEAWQFLSDGGGNTMLRDMIESGFRRARKYHGSFFVITQSLLDRQRFGAIGDIIWANADYKFLLQSPDYSKAKDQKLIDYDEFNVEILKSVTTLKPKYSEIFLDTPFGAGVVRLAVDNFSYYLYTSDPKEVSEMKALVAGGMSWKETIYEMVRRHRS
jgi:conjugal transfer ATP-binding protein TraC